MRNNIILETTYVFLSDHIIIMTIVQKRLKIVRLVEYGTDEYLDNETADNESVSDK